MPGKRSPETFDRFWALLIEPEISELCREAGVSCPDLDRARDAIHDAYNAINRHYTENYMRNPTDLLDRHKVAACYSMAIVAAEPLIVAPDVIQQTYDLNLGIERKLEDKDRGVIMASLANGRLALSVGCSILLSYTRRSVRALGHPNVDEEIIKLGDNPKFPGEDEVAHGQYAMDLANYLCICGMEESFDVLLLGMIYYGIERETVRKQLGDEFYLEIQGERRAERGDASGDDVTGVAGF